MTRSEEHATAWHWGMRLPLMFFVLLAGDIAAQLLLGPGIAALHLGAPGLARLALAPVAVVLLLALYRIFVHRLEKRRPVAELSGTGLASGLLGGAAIGFMMFVAVIALLWSMGFASITPLTAAAFPLGAAGSALLAATGEELIFRGVLFRIVQERFGSLAALVLSAALFGLTHAFNSGATLVSTLAIASEAGLLLAAAFLATRSLWLPIGLHFGWNFTEGGVFGATVSGGRTTGLVKTIIGGPDLISGGAFGPEASIVAVLVSVAVTAVLIAVAVRRGNWRRRVPAH
jgi:hypothetical protein